MTVTQNSFGDLVVYEGGAYLGMAMREIDGTWVAVAANAPFSQLPCLSREHALKTVLAILAADKSKGELK